MDEPWASNEDLVNLLTEAGKEYPKIEYWGKHWHHNAAIALLVGKMELNTPIKVSGRVSSPAVHDWIPNTPEDIKPSKGVIDPYNITYINSGMIMMSAWSGPQPDADAVAHPMAVSSWRTNGGVNAFGFPHLKSWDNATNMHIGSYLAGLWCGRKFDNPELARWSLDCTQNESLLGIYGRGQRPYTLNPGSGEGGSDLVYEVNTAYILRMMELANNEDLSLHPSLYGRYADSIDVNADIYQRPYTRDKETKAVSDFRPSWWRATFHRTQPQDHRWEEWATAPWLDTMAKGSDKGKIALTEACYYAHDRIGKQPPHIALMHDLFAKLYHQVAIHQPYEPAPRPPLPGNVRSKQADGKTVVSWDPVPGDILGYKVFRADSPNGPWTWLNTPYTEVPPCSATKPQKPSPPPPI